MPRRKKYTLSAKELSIYEVIVEELSKNPELAANYDMATIEISVLKTIEPFIKNIDAVISHFEWYVAKNKKYIPVFSGEEIINRILLAKMLGISRQTLTGWIRKGFITPVKSKRISNIETFSTKAVLEQLKRYQAEHAGK
ncbi:hypothetical protein EZS27_021541 [termite gut metagenome]|uniref:Helix-turn-helix domain-containing protein n=1 Tax=termite gut metagenome TaxID=433724 RepID=A0A5J4R7P1_9ZZZZ